MTYWRGKVTKKSSLAETQGGILAPLIEISCIGWETDEGGLWQIRVEQIVLKLSEDTYLTVSTGDNSCQSGTQESHAHLKYSWGSEQTDGCWSADGRKAHRGASVEHSEGAAAKRWHVKGLTENGAERTLMSRQWGRNKTLCQGLLGRQNLKHLRPSKSRQVQHGNLRRAAASSKHRWPTVLNSRSTRKVMGTGARWRCTGLGGKHGGQEKLGRTKRRLKVHGEIFVVVVEKRREGAHGEVCRVSIEGAISSVSVNRF